MSAMLECYIWDWDLVVSGGEAETTQREFTDVLSKHVVGWRDVYRNHAGRRNYSVRGEMLSLFGAVGDVLVRNPGPELIGVLVE